MEGATRYLVVSDDAALTHAQALAGTIYTCFTLPDAKNGHFAELCGHPVVLWPDRDVSHVQFMQAFGMELAADNGCEVKIIDTQRAMLTYAESAELGYDAWLTALALAEAVQVITPEPPEAEPDQIAGAQAQAADSSLAAAEGVPSPEPVAPAPDDIPIEAYADAVIENGYQTPDWVHEEIGDDWADPLDLSKRLYNGKPLDLKLLPEPLQAYVSDESRAKGTDPGISAFAALAACAGLASDGFQLQVMLHDPRWRVSARIWPVVVATASGGKTPALIAPMRLVQELDAKLTISNARKKKDYEYALKGYAEIERAAIKNGSPRPEEPEKPDYEQIWLDRATMEGATDALEASPRGVIWFRDELSGLISEMDRYSSKGAGSGDRELFLEGFNGGRRKVTRAGGRVTLIRNWSFVVCGGIQPETIRKNLGKLQNDGLLQRTIICMARDKRPGLDAVPDNQSLERFRNVLQNLRDMHGEATIKMSPEASQIYTAFVQQVAKLIKYEDNAALASHLGKWEGYAPRMMLLYHLIGLADRGQHPGEHEQISADIARQVCQWFLTYELSHLLEFWNECMAEKTERRFAQLIARYILANDDLTELRHRDHITRPHWQQWEKLAPWERKEAINTLINCSWITPQGTKKNGEGLPVSYLINPKIRAHFAQAAESEKEARAIKREMLAELREGAIDQEPGEDD